MCREMASSDPGSDVDVDVDVDGDVDGTGDLDSGFQPEGARISTTVSQQGHARVNGKFQLQRETLASSHPRVFFFWCSSCLNFVLLHVLVLSSNNPLSNFTYHSLRSLLISLKKRITVI